jgi:hypothetical protein
MTTTVTQPSLEKKSSAGDTAGGEVVVAVDDVDDVDDVDVLDAE